MNEKDRRGENGKNMRVTDGESGGEESTGQNEGEGSVWLEFRGAKQQLHSKTAILNKNISRDYQNFGTCHHI